VIVAVLIVAGGMQPALALPYAFFEPDQTLTVPLEEFELSLRVDASGDSIAGTELYLSFDSEMLELVEATEGSLYAESGVMTWFGAEYDTSSGCWHCYDTLIMAGSYIEGPGEIMHFRFRALNECGSAVIHLTSLGFTDVHRDPLPPAGYEDAVAYVACSGAAGIPVAPVSIGPAAPNPFVSGTEFPVSVPRAAAGAAVRIYDARGRLVRSLPVSGSGLNGAVRWDGRSSDGRPVAAGAYFAEVRSGGSCDRTKVLRIR
jgi:hypothetical protein